MIRGRPEEHLRFVYTVVGQMLLAIVLLGTFRHLTLESFVIVSYLVFILTAEFTAPDVVIRKWRKRLKWFSALGFFLVAFIMWMRIVAILPPGL